MNDDRDDYADAFAELTASRPTGGSEVAMAAGIQALTGASGVLHLTAVGSSVRVVGGFVLAFLLVSSVPLVYGLLRDRPVRARRGLLVWAGWTVLSVVSAAAVTRSAGLPVWADAQLALSCAVAWLVCRGLLGGRPNRVEVARERQELLRLASARERRRFGRDLHDLLGYSLSALTLKVEVTDRLLGRDEERARRELREVLGMSRQALAETRALAERYRDLSLPEELASVRDVLASTGMRVTVTGETGPLDRTAGTVLATVLREGVANLLRHSRATTCRIRLCERKGRVRLALSNDGAANASALPRERGSGLDSLAQRLAEAGGDLTASVDGAGWFHLVAECPVRNAVSAASRRPGRSGSRPVDCAH
ncbi:sensor histidine kinase [Streptomyces sp. NPDC001514]